MADLPSTNSKIQIEETTYRAPVSETLTQRMGASINYCLDNVTANAAAILTETTNRINADNALDARMDAIFYPQIFSQIATQTGLQTLAVGTNTDSYSLTADREYLVTIVADLDGGDYTGAPAGGLLVYLNGTEFSGQSMYYRTISDVIAEYTATGIKGGFSTTFFVPLNTNSFPNGVTINVRGVGLGRAIDYRMIYRVWDPTQGI